LPKEVGQLTRLEWLSVNANALRRCPPEVGRLQRLRTLMLSGNRFVEIPEEIGQLKEPRELWVGGNPLSEECKSWLKDRFGVVPAGVIYDLE
jgi:Leucine-rich repeat (LRR) protein